MSDDFVGLFHVRDGIESDNNFILATFLRGLYYGDSWFSQIPKDIFMKNYKVIAASLLASPNVIINIACLPDDPDTILGYSVLSSDTQTVHWVYVKSAWRRKGVAKTLVPKHPTTVTHLTELGKELLPKLSGAVFNPFSIS